MNSINGSAAVMTRVTNYTLKDMRISL